MTEWLDQNWNGSYWNNDYLSLYIYDENNNLIEYFSKEWVYIAWADRYHSTYSYIPVTEVESTSNKVNCFNLSNNYPNPFNPSTKISWQSPVGSWQTLKIYDVLGNEVATLVDEYKPAGKYEVEFDSAFRRSSESDEWSILLSA